MSDNDSEKEVPGEPSNRFWFFTRTCWCGGGCRFGAAGINCDGSSEPVKLWGSRPK
jgi:hypothetical protein